MKKRSQKEISARWELYSQQQQADILSEFRRRFPEDYYCKAALFEFLNNKRSMEGAGSKGDSSNGNKGTGEKRH